jgi:hypothetical protein
MLKFIKSLFWFTRVTHTDEVIKDDPVTSVMFFDGDMVELLATLAMKFNRVKFTLFSKAGKPMSAKAIQAMRNIESVNFRYFSTTSVL